MWGCGDGSLSFTANTYIQSLLTFLCHCYCAKNWMFNEHFCALLALLEGTAAQEHILVALSCQTMRGFLAFLLPLCIISRSAHDQTQVFILGFNLGLRRNSNGFDNSSQGRLFALRRLGTGCVVVVLTQQIGFCNEQMWVCLFRWMSNVEKWMVSANLMYPSDKLDVWRKLRPGYEETACGKCVKAPRLWHKKRRWWCNRKENNSMLGCLLTEF